MTRKVNLTTAAALLALALGCGHSTGAMNGPSMNNSLNDQDEPPPPEIQSNDILARDAVTSKSKVKHILVGWKDLAKSYGGLGKMDERAARRSHGEADKLATILLARVRAGEPIEPLMTEFSEDPGSQGGAEYDVTATAGYVFEFKRLSLRLNVGEAGLVLTAYGWHVIKRIE